MIRAFYGIEQIPFNNDNIALLSQQQEVYDTIKVHSSQGGLCLIMGEPGTGKSIVKDTIRQNADKKTIVITIARTLHTYSNIIKILCEAFNVEDAGTHYKCEKRLIEEAYNIKQEGKMLVTIIDEAHLLEIETLRKLRLMFDDFPRNHNLVLVGQPPLMHHMALKINEDIKSRITYSVMMPKLNPDDMEKFILNQLDKAGIGHNIFSDEALGLIIRSADGILRKARNLCLSCLLEGVRAQKKQIDIANVNRVLRMPHWRNEQDLF